MIGTDAEAVSKILAAQISPDIFRNVYRKTLPFVFRTNPDPESKSKQCKATDGCLFLLDRF